MNYSKFKKMETFCNKVREKDGLDVAIVELRKEYAKWSGSRAEM